MVTNLRAVVLLAAIIPLILGLLTAAYWNSRRVYRGFGYWVLADLAIGLGYLLIALRADLPAIVSVTVGNALAVYGVVLVYEGVQLFFDRSGFDLVGHGVFGLFLLLQLFLTYVIRNPGVRSALISGMVVFLELRVADALIRYAPPKLSRICRIIALIFALSALFFLVRTIHALAQGGLAESPLDPIAAAVTFVSICTITMWTFYFLFLNSARVELDLEAASQKLTEAADLSRREVAQLALLEETGQLISGSLDEGEILRHTVEAVVNCFGYAEAAISILMDTGKLELKVVGGTEDVGYRPGYQQNLGEGIIGHVGQTGLVYMTPDVEQDPYYYTIGRRSGSALGVPMLSDDQLCGVLYVESATRDAFTQSDIQTLHTLATHVVTAINQARLYASTQAHLVVTTTLHRISQIITSSLELDRIFQTVLQLLQDTFDYTYVSIYLLEGDVLRLGAQVGYPEDESLLEIPITTGIIGRTVQMKQPQYIRDVKTEPAFLRAAVEIDSEICVPLFKKGYVIGVINVEAAPGHALRERDVDVLTALAGPVAIAIDNAHLHSESTALARIDGLTGLLNRRTFDEILGSEVARAVRYDCPLTLLILDIDDFKASNDQWGHPAGDALLKATAALIGSNIRSSDSAARYGGDEFAVILPNTAQADGLELGERLRVGMEALGLHAGKHNIPAGQYTISVGVASFPSHARSAEGLLLAADHAELTAKQLGKNRVFAAASADSSPAEF